MISKLGVEQDMAKKTRGKIRDRIDYSELFI